jgi:hypothetical protein
LKKEQKMTNLQITLANLQDDYNHKMAMVKCMRVQIQDLKFQVSKEKAFAKVLRQSAKAQKLAAREAKKAARIEAMEKKLMALRMR